MELSDVVEVIGRGVGVVSVLGLSTIIWYDLPFLMLNNIASRFSRKLTSTKEIESYLENQKRRLSIKEPVAIQYTEREDAQAERDSNGTATVYVGQIKGIPTLTHAELRHELKHIAEDIDHVPTNRVLAWAKRFYIQEPRASLYSVFGAQSIKDF